MARLISAVFGLAVAAVAASAAAEDMVVIASTAPDIKTGRLVADGSRLDVPAGATVRLVSEDGRAVTLNGPYAGTPGSGGGGKKSGILASITRLYSGDSKNAGTLGGIRAAVPPGEADPWAIDVSRSTTTCVPADGPVILWRPRSSRDSALTLKDLSRGRKVTVAWPKGADTLAWPNDLALTDGATYIARRAGTLSATKVVVHLLPGGLPNDAHRAAWMADNGCVAQAKALLARLR